jgi:hypothetical protein
MSLRISAPRSEYPTVRCPGCAQQMKVIDIEPVVCGNQLERVMCACERCGTRTERFIKPPAAARGR